MKRRYTMIRVFRSFIAAMLMLFCAGAFSIGAANFSASLLNHIRLKWGGDAVERLQSWYATELAVIANRNNPRAVLSKDELQVFNQFWNKIPYASDLDHWGKQDYWATPVEALASSGADCEDYSIAKYFSLKGLGIPLESLRITYVRALKNNEAHMVLAYYPTPDAEPYILDNLNGKLLLASERDDLVPVYSFNDDDLWAGATSYKGKSHQIRLWNELLAKMEKERQM